jgi:hypothetical protein
MDRQFNQDCSNPRSAIHKVLECRMENKERFDDSWREENRAEFGIPCRGKYQVNFYPFQFGSSLLNTCLVHTVMRDCTTLS